MLEQIYPKPPKKSRVLDSPPSHYVGVFYKFTLSMAAPTINQLF